MANFAMEDQKKRSVEVNRLKLIEILKSNKEKHVAAYDEAITGYCEQAVEKLREGYDSAKLKLEKNLDKGLASIKEFDPKNPRVTSDYLTLVEGIQVHLPVPRSCAKEYDAAIDMAEWDVRETLELTHAEFQCFVRDVWEWSSEIVALNASYTKKLR